MPKTCPNCSGARKVQRGVTRSWWEVLLLRPASVEEVCPQCTGTGLIKGTQEEEREQELQRRRNLEAKEREAAEERARRQAAQERRAAEEAASRGRELRSLADDLRRRDVPFVKLMELGVSENDRRKSAVYFLVGLEKKPGERLALSNIDWVREKGVDIDEVRAACGFSAASAEAPKSFTMPTLGTPPPIPEETRRQAQTLFQQAHSANLGSPAQRELYLKALGLDPNLRLAWAELSLVAGATGDYDLADKCKDAIRVFDSGRFLRDYHDVLGRRNA